MSTGDLYMYMLEVLAALAFASWRFPFAYETGFLSLFMGASLAVLYLVISLVVFLVSGSDFYLHWAVSAALGLGFIAHGCAALLFGRRLAVKEEPKRKSS